MINVVQQVAINNTALQSNDLNLSSLDTIAQNNTINDGNDFSNLITSLDQGARTMIDNIQGSNQIIDNAMFSPKINSVAEKIKIQKTMEAFVLNTQFAAKVAASLSSAANTLITKMQ